MVKARKAEAVPPSEERQNSGSPGAVALPPYSRPTDHADRLECSFARPLAVLPLPSASHLLLFSPLRWRSGDQLGLYGGGRVAWGRRRNRHHFDTGP